MKKINCTFLITMFVMLFFVGCGCKQETVRYSLNSFEKSIIPYNETKLLEYKDENGEIIVATASKKEVLTQSLNEDEGCVSTIIESEFFDFSFNNLNINLFVKIEKTYNNKTTFEIRDNNIEGQVPSYLYTFDNFDVQVSEQDLTNISIDGFEYTGVFIFKLSPNSTSTDSKFETIVFSPQQGIVHLKMRSGGYLKLN
ncbi:hypothetical protein [Paenimyroides viscosum]|uniref:Lipoprotein n=1 Tax=Paenimyroides viscosum TaxID=2488729 RepID=A0A3P1B1H8_9FLAO|nr:hypothetical protein [Paenimyroides viscosum]RRA95010.1 hypothetical protein EG242_07395 [Paenimyroides viscosum]